MPFARQNWVAGNQFTPVISESIDFGISPLAIPDGSTLVRTWVAVRFNMFGTGTLPPEFVNETGPFIWGVCLCDDTRGNPGIFAENDDVDWMWRDMVQWGPSVATVPDLSATPQWTRAAIGGTGGEGSAGQRIVHGLGASIHFSLNLPHVFGNAPAGLLYEIFVHALFMLH